MRILLPEEIDSLITDEHFYQVKSLKTRILFPNNRRLAKRKNHDGQFIEHENSPMHIVIKVSRC